METPFFEIRECTNPDCLLRIPIEKRVHQGSFCPRCGASMQVAVPTYQNQACSDPGIDINRGMSVLLDNLRSAYNVGSIFRTADGVGISHVYLCGITPSPEKNPEIEKTSLGAAGHVPWTSHTNALILARKFQEEGSRLIALECDTRSKPIYQHKPARDDHEPIVLVVGNERAGLDPGLIELCDAVLMLPMIGEKNSLNVAVAFGIAAYWLRFQDGSGI